MSPSDVQKIVKKAMVERLKQAYGVDWFGETGAALPVDVSIRGDVVTVCVDSSGEALSKRGYRTWNGEAPLRETLAAALVLQSGWHPKEPRHDPCCGTGTLLIEAAFSWPLNRAPGLLRKFAMEAWPGVEVAPPARKSAGKPRRADDDQCYQRPLHVAGSDIDPEAIELGPAACASGGAGRPDRAGGQRRCAM